MDENEYGINYDIPHAHMFVIEGMEEVRDVIEKNRKSSNYMKNGQLKAAYNVQIAVENDSE